MARKQSRRGRSVAAVRAAAPRVTPDGNQPAVEAPPSPTFDLSALEGLAAEAPAVTEAVALAADNDAECGGCGHMGSMHAGDSNMGACAAEHCDCAGFATETVTAAAGELAWDPEDGVMDLMEDLEELLNPGSDGMFDRNVYLLDVKTSLDEAIICIGWDDYYLAPFTVGADREPVLSPSSDWRAVEAGWIESDEGELSIDRARKRVAAATGTAGSQFGATVKCSCGHTYSEHSGATGSCSHTDGRGTCSCGRFAEAEALTLDQLRTQLTADLLAELRRQNAAATVSKGTWTNGVVAAAVTLPPEHQPSEQLPVVNPSPPAPASTASAFDWTAVLCPEAEETDDGRVFAPGVVDWRELPLTLMGMVETTEGGHVGAQVSGRIETIWRDGDANLIRGAGVFDAGDWGENIGRLVGDGTLRGISVDLAVHSYEVGPRSDYFDQDGNWAPRRPLGESGRDPMDLWFADDAADLITVITSATIGMATVCPFQAFRSATIEPAHSLSASVQRDDVWTITLQAGFTIKPACACAPGAVTASAAVAEAPVLTASAAGLAPVVPPADWFENPQLEGPTAITVSDDGRISGHAAVWNTCHVGIPGVCQTAPTSDCDYAYFHLGEIACEEGVRLACGVVTLDTGHAAKQLGRADATRHYDDTGTVAAHVRVGEDEFGIWVAGAVEPLLSEESLRVLRGSKLSGDWRSVNGNLELVALLAVNTPGFPVPRALIASVPNASPQVVTLLAAGMGEPAVAEAGLEDEWAALLDDLSHLTLAEKLSDLASRAAAP